MTNFPIKRRGANPLQLPPPPGSAIEIFCTHLPCYLQKFQLEVKEFRSYIEKEEQLLSDIANVERCMGEGRRNITVFILALE